MGIHDCMSEVDATLENVLVLKVGTSTLMDPATQLPSVRNMGNLVETVIELRRLGFKVVLITSGAVGFGCKALNLKKRPNTISGKQAMAAVGQTELMRAYRTMFEMLGTHCGQLLITRTDLVHRSRYMNFRNAVKELLKYNVVPIINENDAVATDELQFGDNDSLSAHIAVLCEAKWLFMLTDVDCLYSSNPRTDPDAKAIPFVGCLEELKVDTGNGTGGTSWGTGGMATKLIAAQISTAAGVNTVLANGSIPDRVFKILTNQMLKTAISTDSSLLKDMRCNSFDELPWPGTVFKGKVIAPADQTGSSCTSLSVSRMTVDATPSASPSPNGLVTPTPHAMKPRKRWILSLPVQGKIVVDEGAAKAITAGMSLLAVGIVSVKGNFLREQAVSIVTQSSYLSGGSEKSRHLRQVSSSEFNNDITNNPHLVEIAHCIVTLGSDQLRIAKGKKGQELSDALGYEATPEVAHRQDIVLLVDKAKF
eukprot:GDKK01008299.1.p1 GENE.GDKK01008299.1~~GDKK01008299.1.p1  ORF type:complete len:480 (-),score=135.50 GDKK01008299.1:81-1520(-)